MSWVQNANCFPSWFTVSPERREEFVAALDDLLTFADSWYREGCNFAFHGWARNPNQWVAIASWKSEEILARLRETPEFQDITVRMLDCCSEAMTMEGCRSTARCSTGTRWAGRRCTSQRGPGRRIPVTVFL